MDHVRAIVQQQEHTLPQIQTPPQDEGQQRFAS
jgi:hypothetical protein